MSYSASKQMSEKPVKQRSESFCTFVESESITYVPEGAFVLVSGYMEDENEKGEKLLTPEFRLILDPVYALKNTITNTYRKRGHHGFDHYGCHADYIEAGWEFYDRESTVVGLTCDDGCFADWSFCDDGRENLVPASNFEANKERFVARIKQDAERRHADSKKPLVTNP